jgi:NADPH-dependent curcumin reductase CurA
MVTHFGMYLDWSLHAVFTKADDLTKLQKPANVSLSTYAGVLGMPGLTAFLSLRAFGRMKAGETLFVSTAAGVVGRYVSNISSTWK